MESGRQLERRHQEQWQSQRKGRNDAEPSAKKGCLKCGDMSMSHRVARCPKTAGEAETLLAAQDVTGVTRDVMDALDTAGGKVGTVPLSVPHLAYPYGSDAKPVVMMRSVKINCVTLDTTCGSLVCCAV
ncbi:hypothetical protein DYB28_000658 [Aphanomyces astaci]|uniref:Uncharacterized protein n=1 Tax=Aphanomyces astaci TaxID=112090 RepID=A0A9X8HBR2_APHAT|nr:hypothetical protein DYB28_000658 [Aphanomyces astaci]